MVSHFCHLSVIPSFSLVFRHAPLRSYISDPVSSSWPFLVLITKGVVTIALSLSHYMQLSNVLEESGLPPPAFYKRFLVCFTKLLVCTRVHPVHCLNHSSEWRRKYCQCHVPVTTVYINILCKSVKLIILPQWSFVMSTHCVYYSSQCQRSFLTPYECFR